MRLAIAIFHHRALMYTENDKNGPIQISVMVMLAIVSLCKGNPGQMVTYNAYLIQWARLMNKTVVTLEMLMQDIFPNGFYDEDTMSMIWKMQKVQDDQGTLINALDSHKFYEYVV